MGKIRKQKQYLNKFVNPLGHDNTKWELLQIDQSNVKPIEAIREQLLSAHIEDKINGLQAIAVLAGCQEKCAAIFNSDMIKIIAPFLCEKDEALQNAATGALRNLSICSTEMCEFLNNQDVASPLLKMLCQFTDDNEWQPTFNLSMLSQIDLKSDIFLQGINLLWILCECDALVVELLNHTQLLKGVIRCLDYKIFGFDIAISVAQLLLIVSENNPKSWVIINENVSDLLELLKLDDENSCIFLRTLCAGILTNVPGFLDTEASRIMLALGQTLEKNNLSAFVDFNNDLSLIETKINLYVDLDDKMDTSIEESETDALNRRRIEELPSSREIAFKKLEYLLEAQRLAVEILTNICSLDDNDSSDTSESESVLDDFEIDSSLIEASNEKMNNDLNQLFLKNDIIQKLWNLSNKFPDSVVLKQNKENMLIIQKQEQLRIETFICLQNLSNVLSCEDLGGANFIYNIWVDLGQQVFKETQNFLITEPITALMRSILEHLTNRKDLFSQMTANDLQLILDGVVNCPVSEIRANWLRMLGTLGCMLTDELADNIIKLLIDICYKEDDVWAMSEALDSLMDLFFENDRSELIVTLNLVRKVKEIQQIFKTKKRQQKRNQKTRLIAIQTVLHNLSRFISYLEKEHLKFLSNK